MGTFALVLTYITIAYIWGKYVYVVVFHEKDSMGGIMLGFIWPISFPVVLFVSLASKLLMRFAFIDEAYTEHLRKLRS